MFYELNVKYQKGVGDALFENSEWHSLQLNFKLDQKEMNEQYMYSMNLKCN